MSTRILTFLSLGLLALAAGGARPGLAEPATVEAALPPFPRVEAPPAASGIWAGGIGHGFRGGARQASSVMGFTFGYRSLGSKSRHDLTLTTLRFGRVRGRSTVPGRRSHGNVELVTEVWGGVQTHPRHRSLFGVTPLLRYDFVTGSRWVPFVNAGIGVAYTNIGRPDLSRGFQFNPEAGAGTHYFVGAGLAMTVEYRFFHLSNAGLSKPNTGLNTHMLYVGLTRFY
jgi:opacity protein-like surface antigen